jgi:hypothetical protein
MDSAMAKRLARPEAQMKAMQQLQRQIQCKCQKNKNNKKNADARKACLIRVVVQG